LARQVGGRGLRLGVVGGEAEDFIDLKDEVAPFVIGEFAFGIFHGLKGGAGAGAGLAVFLQEHGFAAGTGEGVHEADEGSGVAAEGEIEGGEFLSFDFRFLIGIVGGGIYLGRERVLRRAPLPQPLSS
jgi:hypothetical protein